VEEAKTRVLEKNENEEPADDDEEEEIPDQLDLRVSLTRHCKP